MNMRPTFLKRSQTGQTIVILALAFVVLLGFVGLVTDISLMFVRYNTLRRAVDSAAVAAAGQMRRAVPTTDEITRANAAGGTQVEKDARASAFAFARNIATVNLAARQFIEFYGVLPSAVLVDTCATTPGDAELECGASQNPRKLVRVTAQLNSPTVFLRLLGWNTVLLEATSISETAVLDVVLIFDSSESMANQTSYDDWEAIGINAHYYVPRMDQYPRNGVTIPVGKEKYLPVYVRDNPASPNYISTWYKVLGMTQSQINSNNTLFPVIAYASSSNNTITNIDNPGALVQPRQECRVRFFPAAGGFTIPYGNARTPALYDPSDDVWVEYTNLMRAEGIFNSSQTFDVRYSGFVPAYNYYGCCNDANGDYDFSDQVCQPFRLMRDTTEKFLGRIDFARGDRVALVTFDRFAYLIDPDGTTGGVGGTGPQTPMITSESNAIDALRKSVGVRAENSFYVDTDNNGLWDSFVIGGGQYNPSLPAQSGIPYRYNQHMTNVATQTWTPAGTGGFDNTTLSQLNDYPVKDNCRFQNATLAWPVSIYSSPPPGSEDGTHPYVASRYPNPLAAFGQSYATMSLFLPPSAMTLPPTLMLPNLNDVAWDSQMTRWSPYVAGTPAQYPRQVAKTQFSYEVAAGCSSSNVGSALRVGNNALLNPQTVRTNGAVWVMVMLGDGAAAGSDPVRRNGGLLVANNPYGIPANPPPGGGQYGAFGLCPYNVPAQPGALVDNNFDVNQPRCSDPLPETRNPFCFNPNHVDTSGNIYIDLADSPKCDTHYDVDDFARDWADYVGLAEPFPELTTTIQNRNALQLPTIFTIGFGLEFQNGAGTCADNVPDCLGEELLRYIADAGDNQRIDTDYQQDLKREGILDKMLTNGDLTYGDRGPCEGPVLGGFPDADSVPIAQLNNIVNPLPPKTNCGNYYNAPDPSRLELVFDDIASRMFTRLTR